MATKRNKVFNLPKDRLSFRYACCSILIEQVNRSVGDHMLIIPTYTIEAEEITFQIDALAAALAEGIE
jgi:adenosylmethionine-8-amino-7-oxononanoate aminotransferase